MDAEPVDPAEQRRLLQNLEAAMRGLTRFELLAAEATVDADWRE